MRAKFKAKVEEIDGRRTNEAIYTILEQGAAIANAKTPADTGHLIQSQTKPQIMQRRGKTVGTVGYLAKYAGAVHDAPGKLKGQPRADFGRTSNRSEFGPKQSRAFGGGTGKGNYWDPYGEPQFLVKGFEEIKPKIPALLKAAYKK